jgi:hypothetical protein
MDRPSGCSNSSTWLTRFGVSRRRMSLACEGDCQESCVRGRFSHHALTNLSSNTMANWVLASHHSRGGIFHVCAT